MMRVSAKSQSTVVALVIAAGVLTGCSSGGEHADLRAFMDEVRARPAGRVEPLPSFEQVPPFAYQASDMRSPFEPPVVVRRVDRSPGGVQVTPDNNRVKQYLEQFPIAALSMVGSLEQDQRRFALVRDAGGGVHRVAPGDYMGTDHGRIQRIVENEMELIEIVPDGTGGWVERARTVTLAGGDRG